MRKPRNHFADAKPCFADVKPCAQSGRKGLNPRRSSLVNAVNGQP